MNFRRLRFSFPIIAAAYFSLVTFLLFGSLLWSRTRVISMPESDGSAYFYPVWQFSFDRIRAGEIPLWNPHIMGGVPALPNFQYALLYPPNWLHLVLSTGLAINWVLALHVLGAGFFTAIWCRARGSSEIAALLGGTLFILSGQYAMHIFCGSFAFVFVATWMPLVFMSIDAIVEDKKVRSAILLGSLAVAMQILGGYPQPAYFTFLAAVLYLILRLINRPRGVKKISWLAVMYVLGAGIAAAQLLPGIEAGVESARGHSADRAFAMSFSLPPENLITSIVPHPFGDSINARALSRWGIVETSIFLGAGGTLLAVIGAIGSNRQRDRVTAIIMLVMLALALGANNPIYPLLLKLVPGLNHFRVPARFATIAELFACALAAAGLDHLRQSRRLTACAIATGTVSLLVMLVGFLIHRSAPNGFDGLWGSILDKMLKTQETWEKMSGSEPIGQIAQSARFAARQFFEAGAILALLAAALLLVRIRRSWVGLLAILAVAHAWIGSAPAWQSFSPTIRNLNRWAQVSQQIGNDDRVLPLTPGEQNLPMQLGFEGIGGYDPSVSARWDSIVAPLMAAQPRAGNLQAFQFRPSSRWQMLRLGATVPLSDRVAAPPMPRLNLISNYTVVANSIESRDALRTPEFDARKTVVLEHEPDPKPAADSDGAPAGRAVLLRMSCNEMEISAELNRPAILLITDGYSALWDARAIEPESQQAYQVLAANHALRAIPLAAGKHRLLLEYRPRTLFFAQIVSGLSVVVWSLSWLKIRRRPRPQAAPKSPAAPPRRRRSPRAHGTLSDLFADKNRNSC